MEKIGVYHNRGTTRSIYPTVPETLCYVCITPLNVFTGILMKLHSGSRKKTSNAQRSKRFLIGKV